MTREEAVKRLKRLYGANVYYRVGSEISSPEKRETAKALRDELKRKKDSLDTAIKDWLAAQPEYQHLISERRKVSAEFHNIEWEHLRYKFEVGEKKTWCVETTGHGDTWEEAIAQAEERRQQEKKVS